MFEHITKDWALFTDILKIYVQCKKKKILTINERHKLRHFEYWDPQSIPTLEFLGTGLMNV